MRASQYHGLRITQEKKRRGEAALPLHELLTEDLRAVGQGFDRKGWVAATAGTFSARLDRYSALITRRGVHKGDLCKTDLVRMSMEGKSLAPGLAVDDEALLHSAIYAELPDAGCILHVHSPSAVVLSQADNELQMTFSGHEMLKAFPGIETHEDNIAIAVLDNNQDVSAMADYLSPLLASLIVPAFVLRGHGIYAWGETIETARSHIEALEFLCQCELLKRQIR